MSHYDEQREKFENQPKPYFVKRETGSPDTRQSSSERNEEIDQLYEELHPIIVD
ncbi:hypothetical protein [Vibrio vulnificus]|jgi:lipase chaperone LimK|uniref:hypothetical protein n=1 Tax=Vibrio vulnificus TaxID=672 RepID=UPI001481DAF9|nr:hypothetical protein [Vibrio vulnificus]EGR8992107.1 hypothetical protein [Vibrio vulnificus]